VGCNLPKLCSCRDTLRRSSRLRSRKVTLNPNDLDLDRGFPKGKGCIALGFHIGFLVGYVVKDHSSFNLPPIPHLAAPSSQQRALLALLWGPRLLAVCW